MPSNHGMHETGAIADSAARLIETAKRAGAERADAIVASGRSLSLSVREGQIEDHKSAEGDEFGLRVFVGKRSAIVSSSDPRPDNMIRLAERAVAMAKLAPEDQFAGLADEKALALAPFAGLDLCDDELPDAARLEAEALEAERAALAVNGVSKSGGAHAGAGLYATVLATSAGFIGAYRRSSFSLSVTAIAGEGTTMHRDSDMSIKVRRTDLETPERIGESAGKRAVSGLKPRKLTTQRVPVIFDKRVSSSLIGHLSGAINGSSIASKTSYLTGKLGERLFAKGIEIVDDPLRQRGLRSRPFDDEGVAGAPLRLIEDGVLTSYLLDSATARELKMTTTGHASRGAGSAPSPSASNLTLQPGSRSPEEMMRTLGKGLLVTQLIGSGVNLITGDYSRGCWGFWFEDGEIAYPVAEITIAGNLPTLFANLEPADDLEFKFATNAPSCFVGEMTLGGR